MIVCSEPCETVGTIAHDYTALCAHLLAGAACVGAWLALAELVATAQQRLDCYERAHTIAPDDLELQIKLAEARLVLAPHDAELAGALRELRARRAICGAAPRAWQPRDPAPALGALLVSEQVVSENELRRVLAVQRARAAEGERALLGDLLIERGIVTPAALVRILLKQFHERRARGEAPQGLGEQLVIAGVISDEQFGQALLEQTRLRQVGRHEPLGKILVRAGIVEVGALQRALDELDELAQYALGV